MNQERTPSGDSPEHSSNPEHTPVERLEEPSSAGLKIAVVLLVVVTGMAAGYGWLQHDAARRLAAEYRAQPWVPDLSWRPPKKAPLNKDPLIESRKALLVQHSVRLGGSGPTSAS